MKKRFLSMLLTVALIVSLMPALPAIALNNAPNVGTSNRAEHWFYDQLSSGAKKIYNAMYDFYSSGQMADGKTGYDLSEGNIVSQADIQAYLNGDRTLFNDFAAAKDAFDLEHSEVWYMDSSYLSFRVLSDSNGRLHAYMGPGRSDNYYISGVSGISDVSRKTAELNAVINSIVNGANSLSATGLSAEQLVARKVQYVHDEITNRISYRFETDCKPGNAGYVRTLYALVTHEGVCEAYARSMQVILTRLGIPCVMIHGTQISGSTPEMHMWNAVQIGSEWYVVDATWDDPVGLDANGKIVVSGYNGEDGGENRTYLLVGKDVTGRCWVPSGFVSDGTMEFSYPEIAMRSYRGDTLYNNGGLETTYDPDSEMESSKAGKYTISFNGMGMKRAADAGYYMLVKMTDVGKDGTITEFDNWYYILSANYVINGTGDASINPYFYDGDRYFTMITNSAEYVEFAITSRAPDGYDPKDPQKYIDEFKRTNGEVGYYHGNGSDIICETGLLYNVSTGYNPPPYVKSIYPDPTVQTSTQELYHARIEFDDVLYHPTDSDISDFENIPNNDTDYKNEALSNMRDARDADVEVDYLTYDPTGFFGGYTPHKLSSRNNVTFRNITWLWACGNESRGHNHSFETCGVTGVEYDFQASRMWADDAILYKFSISGLVGRNSNRTPNTWGWVMSTPSCTTCYRCSGYYWNLWGQPSLLDNPGDLDLSQIVTEGPDGYRQSLQELQDRMKIDDINGRLTLVVEDLSGSRPRSEEVMDALEEFAGIVDVAVKAKSIYEIGFTRICNSILLETGQSLRLSIGFPDGFNYDDSLNGVVFKAYHFTKDEDGNIISVEELPVAVTQYGLVILCKSFSPFEIVALDESAVSTSSNTKTGNVIVMTDGNGKVLVDGVEAVGANGFVSFKGSADRVFTIVPNDGYVVDSVRFGGQSLAVTNNKFVLNADTVVHQNDILDVTFVAASVKDEEIRNGLTSETPNTGIDSATCNHHKAELIPSKEPTCVDVGYTAGARCGKCGAILKAPEPISALGHEFDENGICTVCGEKNSDSGAAHGIIIVDKSAHGSLSASADSARAGSRVIIYAEPDSDYELYNITVSYNRGTVPVTENSDGTYSFVMPTGQVTIGAKFIEITSDVEIPFVDVPQNAWYYENVQYVYANGIMNGITTTTFEPATSTTRAHVVMMLWRMAGEPDAPANSFPDVPAGAWYEKAVNWANANGVVNGIDGRFEPNTEIPREQIATILYRYLSKLDLKLTNSLSSLTSFTDKANISSYAVDAVDAMQRWGIMQGNNLGAFEPKRTTNRAEAAAIFMRVNLLLGDSDGSTPSTGTVTTGMNITPTSDTLYVGEAIVVTAALYPEGNDTITWSVSGNDDESVSIYDFGDGTIIVTAKAVGNVTLTASAGKFSAKCTIKVIAADK